jgi:hypothetical protein
MSGNREIVDGHMIVTVCGPLCQPSHRLQHGANIRDMHNFDAFAD